jgi:DNA-binding transcriptional regulator of glucitol operon
MSKRAQEQFGEADFGHSSGAFNPKDYRNRLKSEEEKVPKPKRSTAITNAPFVSDVSQIELEA